jgi:D-alanyl-D-alanine dipeptidase
VLFLGWLALVAARAGESDAYRNAPPEGWIDLSSVRGIVFDVRYHTAANFTGAPLPGYGVAGAWLRKAPSESLERVQRRLAADGKALKVYDAYRPLRGTLAMVAWAERTGNEALLDQGYIARRSGHNRGHTVDVSIVDAATGAELDMGTPWDTLTPASHTRAATGDALAHRLLLKEVMEAEGWKAYWKEWWHFTFPAEGDPPARDIPYGCFEPPEGTWTAPARWTESDWIPPPPIPPSPCAATP